MLLDIFLMEKVIILMVQTNVWRHIVIFPAGLVFCQARERFGIRSPGRGSIDYHKKYRVERLLMPIFLGKPLPFPIFPFCKSVA